ncbi:hypothetical protein [Ralstonia mannitolilytica]|nr:hypothetical protein [Ralstonia mannitolilytica]MBY4720523.1 hypothetical protein [Ralstonia mannitolilytica]
MTTEDAHVVAVHVPHSVDDGMADARPQNARPIGNSVQQRLKTVCNCV